MNNSITITKPFSLGKMALILLATMLVAVSCKHHDHSHNHDHDHDHHHENVKLFITAYNETLEVFAEADPFVTGQTSEVMVHLTHHDSFKPVEEAMVTMNLFTAGKTLSEPSRQQPRPGIYKVQIKPETIGQARVYFDITMGDSTYRLEGGYFTVFDDDHRALHYAEDLEPTHPASVAFTKEQSWVVNFATAPVKREKLGVIIRSVGEVRPSRSDEIMVSSRTSGMVMIASGRFYEGTQVQSGDILVNISGEGLAEGNLSLRYREAQNNLERANADFERITTLFESRIVSEREWLQSRNEYENARAVFENLSKNFSAQGQVARSPIAGYISGIFVDNGQFVEAGQPIFSVSGQKQMVIRTEIQQRHAHLLPQLATAYLSSSEGQTFSLDELNGQILAVARNANPATHLFPVHLSANMNPGWFPGMLLDVFLETTPETNALVVPKDALVEEQGNYFVFVQLHPESFEKRQVTLGRTDGRRYEILSGLQEDERIVTRGAVIVKIAGASATLDPHDGHVH